MAGYVEAQARVEGFRVHVYLVFMQREIGRNFRYKAMVRGEIGAGIIFLAWSILCGFDLVLIFRLQISLGEDLGCPKMDTEGCNVDVF